MNKRTIVAHNGSFHTDDIFAVATVELAFPEELFEVVRTRDQHLIDTADIVVDVGSIYNPSKMRFDHHQIGGAGKRENDIPYATFGLVWKEFGEKICGSSEVAARIDTKLAQPTDAIDNGVNITTPLYSGVFPYTVTGFLMSYKKEGADSDSELYQTFIELVEIAKGLLSREIANEKICLGLRNEIIAMYDSSVRKELLVLDKNIERYIWRQVVVNFPETLYVVYPSSTPGQWKVDAVPASPDSFESRKKVPQSWAGKRDRELAEVTGVPDAIFSHNGGFMAVAGSKEGALRLAEIALVS